MPVPNILDIVQNGPLIDIQGIDLLSIPQTIFPNNLVHHWKLDEEGTIVKPSDAVFDSVGAINLTYNNTNDDRVVTPWDENGITQDGTTNGIYFKNPTSLGFNGANEISLSCRVLFTSLPLSVNTYIFNKDIDSASWARCVSLRYSGTGTPGGQRLIFELQNKSTTDFPSVRLNISSIDLNVWHTFVFTMKADIGTSADWKCYLNSVDTAFVFDSGGYTSGFTIEEPSSILTIGAKHDLTEPFIGNFYDIQLYTRQLLQADVNLIENGTKYLLELDDGGGFVNITNDVNIYGDETTAIANHPNLLEADFTLRLTNNKGVDTFNYVFPINPPIAEVNEFTTEQGDIKLFQNAPGPADVQFTDDGLLILDDGLENMVLISLLTEQRANDDVLLPEGGTDRKGWVGDSLSTIKIGSLLWLLQQSKIGPKLITLAEQYCTDALEWMKTDNVIDDVIVNVSRDNTTKNRILIEGTITKIDGGQVGFAYYYNWINQTMSKVNNAV